MENKLRKPELNLDWMDAPIKSDKWKNIYFSTDGESVYSRDTHESEEIACKKAKKWIAEDINPETGKLYKTFSNGSSVKHPWPPAYFLSVPWKD